MYRAKKDEQRMYIHPSAWVCRGLVDFEIHPWTIPELNLKCESISLKRLGYKIVVDPCRALQYREFKGLRFLYPDILCIYLGILLEKRT